VSWIGGLPQIHRGSLLLAILGVTLVAAGAYLWLFFHNVRLYTDGNVVGRQGLLGRREEVPVNAVTTVVLGSISLSSGQSQTAILIEDAGGQTVIKVGGSAWAFAPHQVALFAAHAGLGFQSS
jgi:hypothetical protein